MSDLRDSTLVFLIKQKGGVITQICLAMKKRGFGKGRWNAVGGKVGYWDTILLNLICFNVVIASSVSPLRVVYFPNRESSPFCSPTSLPCRAHYSLRNNGSS